MPPGAAVEGAEGRVELSRVPSPTHFIRAHPFRGPPPSLPCYNLTYNGRYSWTNPLPLSQPLLTLYKHHRQHSYGGYCLVQVVPR